MVNNLIGSLDRPIEESGRDRRVPIPFAPRAALF
jgi:hypothetical protein